MNKLLTSFAIPLVKSTRFVSLSRLGGDLNMPMTLPKPSFGPSAVHRSEFLNGMRVACGKPLGSSIAACTVMFQVGARNEFDCEYGVTHFIRAGSVTSGRSYSGFIKSRYLQQMGGYLTCHTDRQTISYTLRCPMPLFADLKCYLLDSIRCTYPDHELGEVRKMIREDLERRPPVQHVLDLVQKACFSGSLSNSVFCVPGRIDSINSDIINNFLGKFIKTNVCTIGSHGVPYEEVLKVAAHIDCSRVERPPDYCLINSCPRGGFEVYDKGPGGDTYIALAVPGAGTFDFCCCVKHAIVAAACGLGNVSTGGHIWDRNPHPPLGKLLDDPFTDFKAFNISYIDNGVFGIMIKTRSKMARHATFRANEFLGNLGRLTQRDIQIGKKRLQVGVLLNDDSCERVAENLAFQIANNVHCDNGTQLAAFIGSIPDEEVMQTACMLANKRNTGQLAYAVVGDVEAAPHDGELC